MGRGSVTGHGCIKSNIGCGSWLSQVRRRSWVMALSSPVWVVDYGSLKSSVGHDGLIYGSWVLILGGF